MIHRWQKKIFDMHGTHFIHAGDEWYILAGQPVPEQDRYDGYPQLENGVGMVRLLEEEVKAALEGVSGDARERRITIATGELAAPFLAGHAERIREKYPDIRIQVIPVQNRFFGERITVSGLLTGQDIKKQLMGKPLGSCLFLPENILRSGEDVFLDDMTWGELENALQVPINIVKSSGYDFIDSVLAAGRD